MLQCPCRVAFSRCIDMFEKLGLIRLSAMDEMDVIMDRAEFGFVVIMEAYRRVAIHVSQLR
jgi:hypothetical protein